MENKDLRYSRMNTHKKRFIKILLILLLLFGIYEFIRFYVVKIFVFDNSLISVEHNLNTTNANEEKYILGILRLIEYNETGIVLNDTGNLVLYKRNSYTILDAGKGVSIKKIKKIDGKAVNELTYKLSICPVALSYEQSANVIYEGKSRRVKLKDVNNILSNYGMSLE